MKSIDEQQKLILRHGRFAVEGPPGAGKSFTLEGYNAWQETQGNKVLNLVRKREEARNLRSRGLIAYTLQSHRYKALGCPEVLDEKDLAEVFEGLQEDEKQVSVMAVDEIHNWSPEFFDVARSLWKESGDFICFFDEHQALMRWSGAVNDLQEELKFTFGVEEVIHLTNNYRSTPKIVSVLNTIVPRDMISKCDSKWGYGKFHIEKCCNQRDELAFIHNKIVDGVNDIQILARNNYLCRTVSEFLKAKHVDHQVYLKDEGYERFGPCYKRITVQTVHTAQATQHESVFLMSVNQGTLPDVRSDLQSEHNVFYVGCSRAIQNLYISYYKTPSQFITKELVRKRG
jgi:superfamily I DNA/RNA helicase